jgi:hypothetical protein
MRTFVILGLTALTAAACQDPAAPSDAANPDGGMAANTVGTSTLSLVDALGAASPATHFSVFGSSGWTINSSQIVGPEFTLTQTTTITEIGGFVNNCASIDEGSPQCPGTVPFKVQIRPSRNGIPDPATVLASFTLSHDDDPLVISYESVSPNLTLGPGRYFALFAPQGSDTGFLLDSATDPFNYRPEVSTLGFLDPGTRISFTLAEVGAVRILGARVTPGAAVRLLMTDVRTLLSQGQLTRGRGDGLMNKLQATVASLEKGRTNAACNQLRAFVNQVRALVRSAHLRTGAGQALIDAANRIRSQIRCR